MEGFNNVPTPGENEVAVAWTTSGEDPFYDPDPPMYDWLSTNGSDLLCDVGNTLANIEAELKAITFQSDHENATDGSNFLKDNTFGLD